MTMGLFEGLSAFPLTPTDTEGRLQPDALCRFLDRILDAKVDSIGLLGSTGGYAYLGREERQRTLRVAVEHVAGKLPIIVGVGALRTDEACALACDARSVGADGLLLAPMSYQPLTDEEVYRHFEAVAGAGALPLCVYNNPGVTKFVFSDALIVRLSKLPNVSAVKMPLPANGDFAGELARLRPALPRSFSVGYSGDWGAADALLAGADCWFSVVAGLLPGPAVSLKRAAQAGDGAEAARIDAAFRPLWQLFKEFGSYRVMHAVAGCLDLAEIKPPRPVLPIEESARHRVVTALRRLDTYVGSKSPPEQSGRSGGAFC
jgi:4-hydroxy-tetrahydrodipicolinate synthase